MVPVLVPLPRGGHGARLGPGGLAGPLSDPLLGTAHSAASLLSALFLCLFMSAIWAYPILLNPWLRRVFLGVFLHTFGLGGDFAGVFAHTLLADSSAVPGREA